MLKWAGFGIFSVKYGIMEHENRKKLTNLSLNITKLKLILLVRYNGIKIMKAVERIPSICLYLFSV